MRLDLVLTDAVPSRLGEGVGAVSLIKSRVMTDAFCSDHLPVETVFERWASVAASGRQSQGQTTERVWPVGSRVLVNREHLVQIGTASGTTMVPAAVQKQQGPITLLRIDNPWVTAGGRALQGVATIDVRAMSPKG